MHFQLLPAVVTLSALASTYAQPIAEPEMSSSEIDKRDGVGSQFSGQCTDGIAIYTLRGSDPNYHDYNNDNPNSVGSQDLQDIAYAGRDGAGSGYVQAIRYPATIDGYQTSLEQGIRTLKNTLEDYVAKCPNGKVGAVGYSQGAQAITGVLGGSVYTSPLDANGRFAAGVAIADPTRITGLAIDRGDATRNGQKSGDGSKYNFINQYFQGRFVSFCQSGDRYCDNGGTAGQEIHNTAVPHFKSDAASFMYGAGQRNA